MCAIGALIKRDGGRCRRKGKVQVMAEEKMESNNTVEIPFPDKTWKDKGGNWRSAVWTSKNRPDRSSITFPPHTPEVTTVDGAAVDISFGKIWVDTNQISEVGKDGFRTVSLPEVNAMGRPRAFKVTKDQGHHENGEYVADAPIEVMVSVGELSQAMESVKEERIRYRAAEKYQVVKMPEVYRYEDAERGLVSVPLFGKEYLSENGQARIPITFPPHTPELQTLDGDVVDVSNFTMWVNARDVTPAEQGFKNVSFPKRNSKGQPWNVEVTKQQGHWENPEGTTREERGGWVAEEPLKARIPVSDVAMAMAVREASGKDWAEEQRKKSASKEKGGEAQDKEAEPNKEKRARPKAPGARTAAAKSTAEDAKEASEGARARAAQRPQGKVQAK